MFYINSRSLKRFLVVLATSTFAIGQANSVSAAASKDGYRCEINPSSYNGWVPRKMEFRFLENDTKVVVWDDFIEAMDENPKTVKVKRVAGGTYRFRWALPVMSTDGSALPVSYRVDFDPNTLAGKIKATVAGSSGRSNGGTFTCKAANVK